MFIDFDRVAIIQYRFNQCLRGILARLTHSTDVTALWLATAAAIAVASMALAVILTRRQEKQWASGDGPGVGLVVSPVSVGKPLGVGGAWPR